MITPGNNVRISADETTNCTVDGTITEIQVNGNKIMAIHEMAQRLHRVMVAFTCMCVAALLMFGTILYIVVTTHPSMEQIEGVISNSNENLKITKTIMRRQVHHIEKGASATAKILENTKEMRAADNKMPTGK